LKVTKIAQREEAGIRTIYRDLDALQTAGFPLYTERVEKANRWAFIDTFKFKIPPPFTLTELMSQRMSYFLKSSGDKFLQIAQISFGNGGLDILFFSGLFARCGEWHGVHTFDNWEKMAAGSQPRVMPGVR
jgi:hypothetical protein